MEMIVNQVYNAKKLMINNNAAMEIITKQKPMMKFITIIQMN